MDDPKLPNLDLLRSGKSCVMHTLPLTEPVLEELRSYRWNQETGCWRYMSTREPHLANPPMSLEDFRKAQEELNQLCNNDKGE